MAGASDCDVLICGLGPVGQLLALLLGALGVRVIAVDPADGPHDLPRAAVIDDEVLRILQSVDLDERVLADAQIQRAVSFVTGAGRAVEVLSTARGKLGQPPLVSIHQPTLERTMVAAIADRGAAQLRWGWRLESTDQSADRVTATIRPAAGPAPARTQAETAAGPAPTRTQAGPAAGGPPAPITARYLVGCDGAASTVRSLLRVPFGGLSFAQRWLVVDALVDRPLARVPHPQFVGDPRRPAVSLPMSPGRHRWEWMLHPDEDQDPLLEHDRIRELLAPWIGAEHVEIERAVVYGYHARTAERWRVGRIFLAGDAAHVMPPFAGQGLSSGARDAGNLAWKLHAALNGAPTWLLDTYERERRPHVTSVQALAVRWGGLVQTVDPRVGRVRDRAVELLDRSRALSWIGRHAKPLPTYAAGAFARAPARLSIRRDVGALFPQPTIAGRPLDDLLGPGWSAVATSPRAARRLRGGGLPVVELSRSQWPARYRAGWVILRPDRYVFARGRDGGGDAGAAGGGEIADALWALNAILGQGASGRPV